jgi:hypothetical protein
MYLHNYKVITNAINCKLGVQPHLTSFTVNQGQEVCEDGEHGGLQPRRLPEDGPRQLQEHLRPGVDVMNQFRP